MRSVSATFLAILVAASAHGSLGIGDSAPLLKTKGYLKGAPVNLKHGVHIVEFWATWCGPCRMTIPHLTELAKEYKGKVDFTGVSVMERGSDADAQVKSFVKQMGSKMNYNVAYDGSAAYMSTHWLDSAGIDSIPTAFLVKDGKILWIGNPMDNLPTRLDQTLNGTFNVARARKDYMESLDERFFQTKVQEEMGGILAPLEAQMKASDGAGVVKTCDAFSKQYPTAKWQTAALKARLLVQIGDARGFELARQLGADHFSDNPALMSQLAWPIVAPGSKATPGQLAIGLELARKSVEISKSTDGDLLDTYAMALYRTGNKAKAAAAEAKALVLLRREGNPQFIQAAQERLAMFKK